MIQQPFGRIVVVCEGASDSAFFRHLAERREIQDISTAFPEPPDPGGRQGFGSLLKSLRILRGFDEVAGVLVVSDNDVNPNASFQEVQSQIRAAGRYGIPSMPKDWVRGMGTPQLAIYMLPEKDADGDLEQLCLIAARAQWPAILSCADNYARCTKASEWPVNKLSKMLLRSVLSAVCKTDPNTSLRYLWSRGSSGAQYEIRLDHSCFNDIAEFLTAGPK